MKNFSTIVCFGLILFASVCVVFGDEVVEVKKNPYVEERVSNEEKALYYKDPLKYMESLSVKDKNYDNEYSYREL